MIRSKRGLVVVALCAAALGLVALGTSISQAEKGAKWSLINAKGELLEVTEKLLPEVVMKEIVTKDMTLLTQIAKKSVELLCNGAAFINAKLEMEGRVGGGNQVEFTGCTMKVGGVTQAACKPHTKGKAEGTLLSNALKGELILYEGKSVIQFKPVTGETFLTLVLGKEGIENECTVGEKCAINGTSTVADVNGKMGSEEVTHTVEQFAPLSELWVGTNPATVDGQGTLALAGEHLGLKWAGSAG
jgi:hypothetical protein